MPPLTDEIMSETNHQTSTMGTDHPSPTAPHPNRNHKKIIAISDFFRARIRTRLFVPTRDAPAPSATLIPQPPISPSRYQLIPIKVLLEHSTASPLRVDPSGEDTASVPPGPVVPPTDPQAHLQQAQRRWAAMFEASATEPVAGH
jgi:hypothetical protein